jgi:hypothetical protein
MLLVISLLYGLVIGTCRSTIPSWSSTPTPTPTPTPCPDPCDQATLDVRVADPAGGTGPIELEPAAPVQGCPLTVKWASCYDEKDYDPKTIACTPVVPLTLSFETKERVTIVDSKGASAVYLEIDDTIDLGCDGSRSYTWSEPKAGDYSVNVELDLHNDAKECDNQKLLGFTDLNSDNTQGVQFTVGCPCQGHESYDLRIADLKYDAATRRVEWSACLDWVACTKAAEEVAFDETIEITETSSGEFRHENYTGAVPMGGCIGRSYDVPAGVDAGDYEITVGLTAQAPFADCDPATATKNTSCKQIADLATNNSSSISLTIK